MTKKRKNVMLSVGVIKLLDTLKKQTGHSESLLMENAVWKTYQDPVEILTEQKRKLLIKVYDLDKKIEKLKVVRNDKKFKGVKIPIKKQ